MRAQELARLEEFNQLLAASGTTSARPIPPHAVEPSLELIPLPTFERPTESNSAFFHPVN